MLAISLGGWNYSCSDLWQTNTLNKYNKAKISKKFKIEKRIWNEVDLIADHRKRYTY